MAPTIRERWRKAVASQEEVEADEERTAAHRSVGCVLASDVVPRRAARVSGIVRSVTLRPRQGVPALEAELYDGSGTILLIWLGRRRIAGIEPGRRLRAEGRVCLVRGAAAIFDPRYELMPRPGE